MPGEVTLTTSLPPKPCSTATGEEDIGIAYPSELRKTQVLCRRQSDGQLLSLLKSRGHNAAVSSVSTLHLLKIKDMIQLDFFYFCVAGRVPGTCLLNEVGASYAPLAVPTALEILIIKPREQCWPCLDATVTSSSCNVSSNTSHAAKPSSRQLPHHQLSFHFLADLPTHCCRLVCYSQSIITFHYLTCDTLL